MTIVNENKWQEWVNANLLARYLADFNREYLARPDDRARLWETLLNGGLTLVLLVIVAIALWMSD